MNEPWTLETPRLADLEASASDDDANHDADGVALLAEAIAHDGLTSPLIGYRDGDSIIIVDGNRRLAALARLAAADDSRCRVHEHSQVYVWIADRQTSEQAAARANFCRHDRSAVARALNIKYAYGVPDAPTCGAAQAEEHAQGADAAPAFRREAVLACLRVHLGVSGETARRFLNHAHLPEATLRANRHGPCDSSTGLDALVRAPKAPEPAAARSDTSATVSVASEGDVGSDDPANIPQTPSADAPVEVAGPSPQVVARALNDREDESVSAFFEQFTDTAEPRVIRIARRHFQAAHRATTTAEPTAQVGRETGGNNGITGGGGGSKAVSDARAEAVVRRLFLAKRGRTYRDLEAVSGIPKGTACPLITRKRKPDAATASEVEAKIDEQGKIVARGEETSGAAGAEALAAQTLAEA